MEPINPKEKSFWWWPVKISPLPAIAAAALTGLLLALAFVVPALWWLGMVGWLPLLIIEETRRGRQSFLRYAYLGLLVWNIGATWWIKNATLGGAIAAIVANSFLMLLPLAVWRGLHKRFPGSFRYPLLVSLWLLFEWGHLNWDLTWSWLNLGHLLAYCTPLAQWYQYTGVLGGSLYFWAINIAIFQVLKTFQDTGLVWLKKEMSIALVTIALPALFSLFLYISWAPNPEAKTAEVVVLQPNVDPYKEKFGRDNEHVFRMLTRLQKQSDSALTDSTQFLLWPETAIPWPSMIYEPQAEQDQAIIRLRYWLLQHTNLHLLTGINSFIFLEENPYPDGRKRIEDYNAALFLSAAKPVQIYRKSKLVPGVELMPYPKFFQFLEAFAIDLGGAVGSLGTQEERTVFFADSAIGGVAPVICYESIFGSFVGEYYRNQAGFIGLITNDAWWGNTPGHKQHFAFGRLRAIENRTMVARSANTGISGFINERGDVLQKSEYDTPAALRETIRIQKSETLYARFGDWLGYLASLAIAGMLGLGVYFRLRK